MTKYVKLYEQFLLHDSFISDEDYNMKHDRDFSGGAFGHCSHIFEDMSLTFDDMKQILKMLMKEDFSFDGIVAEKCLHGDCEVVLENNGITKISNVVNNKIEDKILSYDFEKQANVFNQIIDWSNNGEEEEWLEIETEDGNKTLVTANHRMFVDGIGDVKAENLKEGMSLIIK